MLRASNGRRAARGRSDDVLFRRDRVRVSLRTGSDLEHISTAKSLLILSNSNSYAFSAPVAFRLLILSCQKSSLGDKNTPAPGFLPCLFVRIPNNLPFPFPAIKKGGTERI